MGAVVESRFRTSATSRTCRSSRCWSSRATPSKPEDPLVSLESDKATMEVPAPRGGHGEGAQGQGRRQGRAKAALILLLDAGRRSGRRRRPPRRRAAVQAPPSPTSAPRRHRRGARARHRRLQGRPGHRGLRQAGRHGEGGGPADHARVGQGDDGRAVAARRHGARRSTSRSATRCREGAVILSLATGEQRPVAAPSRSGRAGSAGRSAAAAAQRWPAPAAHARRAAPARAQSTKPRFALAYAGPGVRKFARELGVDLGKVKGSGPRAASCRKTSRASPRARLRRRKPAAAAPAAGGGVGGIDLLPGRRSTSPSSAPSRRKPLSRIKKISGANLHRNWVVIPHVTQPRRRRHHRPRGIPRAVEQGEREERRQALHARRS